MANIKHQKTVDCGFRQAQKSGKSKTSYMYLDNNLNLFSIWCEYLFFASSSSYRYLENNFLVIYLSQY